MIEAVQVKGYRGFKSFEMSGLKRINLLVGTNNCGKTSLLEAILLLYSGGPPMTLHRILSGRGERLRNEDGDRELDICHLFYGHQLRAGSEFSIDAPNTSPRRFINFSIQNAVTQEDIELFSAGDDEYLKTPFELKIEGTSLPLSSTVSLSQLDGISLRSMRRTQPPIPDKESEPQFISTDSLSVETLQYLWNDFVLKPAEDEIVAALRVLDSKIERIAVLIDPPRVPSLGLNRGGFRVKLRNIENPVPIGSMGDGIWRMFALALALYQSKNSVLLVDEIDTGLHYSVMTDMWRLIANASEKFNIQVFATTHSSDCVRSLAEICNETKDISIQRIEQGNEKSVTYSEDEIKIASDHGIEVR